MNAHTASDDSIEGLHHDDDSFGEALKPRPRARYLTPLTALLMALILGGVGFFAGIRAEKSHSTSGGGASGLSGLTAASGTAAGKSASSTKTGTRSGTFAGGAPGTGGGTEGTVTSVKGDTLYVKESNGNTVKVKLSKATTVTKDVSAARNKVYPGDTISVTGSTGSNGTVQATAVSDSGASSSSSSSSTSSGSTTSSSSVSSLFGSGS